LSSLHWCFTNCHRNKITHKNKVFIKTLSYILLVRPATRRMKNKWIRIKRTVRLRYDVRPGTCRMKKKWSHRQAIKQALKHSSKQRVRIKRKSLKNVMKQSVIGEEFYQKSESSQTTVYIAFLFTKRVVFCYNSF